MPRVFVLIPVYPDYIVVNQREFCLSQNFGYEGIVKMRFVTHFYFYQRSTEDKKLIACSYHKYLILSQTDLNCSNYEAYKFTTKTKAISNCGFS